MSLTEIQDCEHYLHKSLTESLYMFKVLRSHSQQLYMFPVLRSMNKKVYMITVLRSHSLQFYTFLQYSEVIFGLTHFKVMFTALNFVQTQIVMFTVFSFGHLYLVILNSVILTSLKRNEKMLFFLFLMTDESNMSSGAFVRESTHKY